MVKENNLFKISQEAQLYMNEEETLEVKEKMIKLFYELVEELNYHDAMIVSSGVYNEYNEKVFDIVLKTNEFDDESVKIYAKFIPKGEPLDEYEDLISTTATYEIGTNTNRTVYFIIYNLEAMKIYSVSPGQTSLIILDDSLEIVEMDKLIPKKYILDILDAEDEELMKEEKEEDNIDETEMSNEIKYEEPKKGLNLENVKLDKTLLIRIGLIAFGIIILFLILSYLFKGTNTSTNNNKQNENNPIINNNVNNNDTNPNLNDNLNTEAYLKIKAVLDLTVVENKLSINLISDLEDDAIVKIGIFCGDNSEYQYISTKDGKGSTQITIPSTWGEEKITVGAYLKFNEATYNQPSNITKKYGNQGQYIIWNEDYSKDMITYSTTKHSNALVIALKEQKEKDEYLKMQATITRDFQAISTRVDAFGNIKHVPLNFDLTNTNISERTNIYPMIFYDAKKDESKLYIICGFVGTQFANFTKVSFSADGFNWTYDNEDGKYDMDIVGNKKAEWIYFNHLDTQELIADMKLFSNSKEVSISLLGSLNKKFVINQTQLDNIKFFIYLFENYYGNGTKVPNTEWFEADGAKIKLDYIKKPNTMYQRGSGEINSLNNLQNKISQQRLLGQEISQEDLDLINLMNKTYRNVSNTIYDKIMNALLNAEGTAIVNADYETNKKYMKIYFKYNTTDITYIENGYIPYINIYDDYKVIVPIQTISAQTKETDTTYCQFKITETLYNELKTYFDNTAYETIE